MNKLRVFAALIPVVVVLAASQWCFAESITLLSSSGGVYDYGLVLPPGVTVTFHPGQTITLSGLSGVTGASFITTGSPPITFCFGASSFTPSSAIYTDTNLLPDCSIGGGPSGATAATLVVDSSVQTLGTIDWSMQTSGGTITGTTQGPVVSAVPEPTSLVLLGTTMLGLVGLARRRSARTWRLL